MRLKPRYTLKDWNKEVVPLINENILENYCSNGHYYLIDKYFNKKYRWKIIHNTDFWRKEQQFIECLLIEKKANK